MVGSVAGVGQFLETVGVPGPQVGTQTGQDNGTNGLDFASALQQAGGPSAQDLAAPVSGREDADADAKSPNPGVTTSATGAAGAQTGSVKTAGTAKSAAPIPSVSRVAVGQPLSSAGRAPGIAIASANLAGSKQTQTASLNPLEIVGAKEIAPVATAPVQEEPSAVSLSGTAKTQPAVLPAIVPTDKAPLVAQAPAVAVASLKSAAPTSATTKMSEAPKAEVAKAAVKADASFAIDSKLTTVVPQGTTDVTQSANLAAPAAPLPATAAAVPSVPFEVPSGSSRDAVTAAPEAPAAWAASAVAAAPPRITAVQAGHVKQPEKTATDLNDDAVSTGTVTTVNAPASAKTSPSRAEAPAGMPVPAAGTTPSSAPIAPSTKLVAKTQGAATELPVAPVANAATAAPAAAIETGTAPTASPEQANAGFQAALQIVGPAQAVAPKPGLQAARGAVPVVKPAGETAATGSANVVAGSVVTAATAAQAPSVPVSAGPAATAHAPLAAPKASPKAGEQAAPVQGAPLAAKATAETLSTPETAAKTSSDAGHAVAPVQPAPLPVEAVAVVAGSVPVPVSHEIAGGTTTVSGVAGISGATGAAAGAQDAGGTPGLSHTTLSSSPTSLEVGVSSGTHGWLKIRAELNATGEVNASLTGATPAAAEKLRGELPALSDYLQGEKLSMGTLDVRSALHTTLMTAESSATFGQSGSGQGSAHQGSGQANANGAAVGADGGSAEGRAQQQQTPRGGDAVPVVSGTGDEVVLGRVSDAAMYANSMELGDSAGPSSVGYGTGGGWLNVRA